MEAYDVSNLFSCIPTCYMGSILSHEPLGKTTVKFYQSFRGFYLIASKISCRTRTPQLSISYPMPPRIYSCVYSLRQSLHPSPQEIIEILNGKSSKFKRNIYAQGLHQTVLFISGFNLLLAPPVSSL